MYIPDDSLTRDDALEQAAACMRLARAIGSGNEHLIPDAQRLLHHVGKPGPFGSLVDSAVAPNMDSELPPRAQQPADNAPSDAPAEPADERSAIRAQTAALAERARRAGMEVHATLLDLAAIQAPGE